MLIMLPVPAGGTHAFRYSRGGNDSGGSEAEKKSFALFSSGDSELAHTHFKGSNKEIQFLYLSWL